MSGSSPLFKAAALAAAFSFAPAAAAEPARVAVRVLHLTGAENAARDSADARLDLEDRLNDGDASTLYVVVRRPFREADVRGFKEHLDRYAPRVIVAPRPLPDALRAALPRRDAPPALTAAASVDATVRAVREGAGRPPVPGSSSPAERARTHRLRALAHLELDEFKAAHDNIARTVMLAPDDRESLKLLQRLDVIGSGRTAPWLDLEDAERRAAAAGLTDAQRGSALREVAELRLKIGDAVGGEQDLERAARLSPGDPDIRLALAQALRERPQAALPHAERAAALAAPLRRKAAAHRLVAELKSDLGDAAGARASAERALALAPDDLDALWTLARVDRSAPARAAALASRVAAAASLHPLWRRAAAQRIAARVCLELGDRACALASLRRALEVDADDLDALEALVQLRRKDPAGVALPPRAAPPAPAPRAESELDAALRADPEDLDALRSLVSLRVGQGRREEALGLAERYMLALKHAPVWQQLDAHHLAAGMWAELGMPIRALQAVLVTGDLDSRTLKTAKLLAWIEPSRREMAVQGQLPPYETEYDAVAKQRSAHVALGDARAELGDAAGAEAAYGLALAQVPGDAQTLRALTAFLLDQGRAKDALRRARELAAADAKEPPEARAEGFYLKARAQLALSDEKGAEASLRKVLESAPSHAKALAELTRLQLARGRPQEALRGAEALAAAVASDPPAPRAAAHWLGAQARRALKDADGERAELEKTLAVEPGHVPALEASLRLAREQGRDADARRLAALLPGRSVEAVAAGSPPPAADWNSPWDLIQSRKDSPEAVAAVVAAAPRETCAGEPFRARADRLPLAYFDACLAAFPDDAVLLADRGVARFRAGLRDEALADLKKAVTLKPDLVEARVSLASALLAAGRSAEALAEADAALALGQNASSPLAVRLRELQASLRGARAR